MSYERSAPVYDAIYTSLKDYAAEARRIDELVRDYSYRLAYTPLLDVACGTGLHMVELAKLGYLVHGTDLSEAQLEVARGRTNAPVHQADMTTFTPAQTYHVVTCLFSAIGHIKPDQLDRTVANLAACLERDSVLLVEPWLQPHMWQPGRFSWTHVERPDLVVTRTGYSTVTGNVVHLEMHHLVGRPSGTDYFREEHDLTMFTEEQFHEAFARAGLTSVFLPEGINPSGRGIYVATRPAA